MQKRSTYSREYKLEAVQLARQSDITLTQVAHNLGINANMLVRWCKQFDDPDKTAFQGKATPETKSLPD